MPRVSPLRPFTPDPAQMALRPDVSGNDINGLNDPTPRNPAMVYWAPNPDDIPHGQMQKWFYTARPTKAEDIAEQDQIRAERQVILDAELPNVAADQTLRDAAGWRDWCDEWVTDGLCEQVGVADMQPDWVFEGYQITLPRVVVFGVVHDYDRISEAPQPRAGNEVLRQYMRAADVAKRAASALRRDGWQAEPVTGPMTGSLALIPAAIAAGFGELGKHGSILNPEMGASFRLSAVLTDAPLAASDPLDLGVDAFCQNCRICEDACPPEALFAEKQTVRGTQKWYVDFDKCLPFFNQHQGCAICIAVCPWSRPGIGVNIAAKLAKRRAG